MFLPRLVWAVVRALFAKRADPVAVPLTERLGEMSSAEAIRWKHGIFGMMEPWGLEPEDLLRSVSA